ncbi:terminase small subunit [Methylobacterium sp. Leaf117]|uniref:terminase small subunit n=1 Tax=Methylobacterium sp. Leaf117 TaxID=1736260 RepID=UPI0006F5DE42|nr:terminase small subunit [Methylobacterium sp. Leaf117]KQP91549.1 hypothetical protein ASF57_23045 [Methylobacterium sp. Leaf117]
MRLNPAHRAFVDAYLVGPTMGNATQSAIAASYAADSAGEQGHELLKRQDVRKVIDDHLDEAAARTGLTLARLQAELMRIGFVDIREIVQWRTLVTETGEFDDDGVPITRVTTELVLTDWSELDAGAAAAIAEIKRTRDGTVSIKLHPKVAALVELGRHLGIATKVAHTGHSGSGPVETITREMTAEEAAESYRRTLEDIC